MFGFLTDKPDAELIRGMQRGERRCFEALYKRYAPMVRTFVGRMIKDQSRADDITQDIFMKLYVQRMEIQPEESLKGWLFVSARHKVLDVLKSKWVRDVEKYADVADALPDVQPAPESREPSPEVLLDNMADTLPGRRAEVFRMSKLEHMSSAQIAEALGLSVRTVDKHLELAMKDLRKNFN